MRFLIRMLWLIPTLLFVVGVALYLLQDRLMFFPSRYSGGPIPEGWERVRFEIGEGKQTAFYRGPEREDAPDKLWLVFVGNASLALHWRSVADEVIARQPGFGFLLFDYPGYGECEGKPGRRSINRSVDAAIEALAGELSVEVSELKAASAFLGQSLGTAVAFETAARWESPEVVAISPFTSIRAMASRMVSPVLAPLARHRWDNVARLAELAEIPGAKVTVIHGDADEIIPCEMGAALVASQPEIVEFQTVPGAGHNDIFMEIGDIIVDLLAEAPDSRKPE